MARRRRNNPRSLWADLAFTVGAGVVTSLVTVLILQSLRKADVLPSPAVNPAIAPGQTSV